MATATGLLKLQNHLLNCMDCTKKLPALPDSSKNAIQLFCKSRQLQRMVDTLKSKGIKTDFLRGRLLKVILQETLLRETMTPAVARKCDEIVAHFFASY